MKDHQNRSRLQMVEGQLRPAGILDERVLAALAQVPREAFVPVELYSHAYVDAALQIECGQTISQPLMVALMTEALRLTGTEKVLEIGTGSGYQAAVLSLLAAQVVSIERHPFLAEQAANRLAALGYTNVRVIAGDGTLGFAEEAPYDRVIVTAAGEQIPQALLDQLKVGGLLVMPIGAAGVQELTLVEKLPQELRTTPLGGCRFVPLVGGNP